MTINSMWTPAMFPPTETGLYLVEVANEDDPMISFPELAWYIDDAWDPVDEYGSMAHGGQPLCWKPIQRPTNEELGRVAVLGIN